MNWYTADLHLGHKKIIELCDRPFSSIDNMNATLINNWNEVVGAKDYVYILGDLAMGNIHESLELVKELKGFKFLIPGNHDRVFKGYNEFYNTKSNRIEWLEAYRNVGLNIMPGVMQLNSSSGFQFTLSHFPYRAEDERDNKYDNYRPLDIGQWLVHGHVHKSWKVSDKMINVGVDVWDFSPVNADILFDIMA